MQLMQVQKENDVPRGPDWQETIEEENEDEHADARKREEEEENEMAMRSDQSIYGSSSTDSTSLETQGISLVFQLNSLTECTSCSDNENVPGDDNSIEWERRKKKKKQRRRRKRHASSRQSIQVRQDKQCKSSGDEEEEAEEEDKRRRATFELESGGEDEDNKMNESESEQSIGGMRGKNKCTQEKRSSGVTSTRYQVMSEVKLSKYDFDGRTLKLLSKLHEQLGNDNCSLDYRAGGSTARDRSIKCDAAVTSVTGHKDAKSTGNRVNCKLCNILACRFNESWDLLDSETVTLMDIIERLSRILSDKAKQLIVKLKRKQQQHRGETRNASTYEVRGEDEAINEETESRETNSPRMRLMEESAESRNPLRDLKDSGIAVRKVENRKRFITLRDGPIEYCIQGKRSLLHVLTFLPVSFTLSTSIYSALLVLFLVSHFDGGKRSSEHR